MSVSSPIEFTPKAIAYIQNQLMKHPKEQGIRLDIKKSGCSGWIYVFEYGQPTLEDSRFTIEHNINVFISPRALQVLNGAKVDYVQVGLNARLECINPNELARCGCGESFIMKEHS